MEEAIVDACCLINLYATGDIRGFLSEVAWSWHMPSAALAESLYIRVSDDDGDDRREAIEPQACIDEGLLASVDVQNLEEADLYVRLASDLDDGEAMALAIAKLRGWTIATDDRKAIRFSGNLRVPVVTTPELIQLWVKAIHMPSTRVKTHLRRIESGARFSPAEDAQGYDWWTAAVSGDSIA